MNEVSDMFVKGFCAKCAELGVDAEELIKQGARGDYLSKLIRTIINKTGPGQSMYPVNQVSEALRSTLSTQLAPAMDRLGMVDRLFGSKIPSGFSRGNVASRLGVRDDSLSRLFPDLKKLKNILTVGDAGSNVEGKLVEAMGRHGDLA